MKTLATMMDLQGRVALIIGAAGQLALAVEETLLEMGASLVLWDIDKEALTKRASALTNTYPNPPLSLRYIDIRNEKDTRLACTQEFQSMRNIPSIIIHCAAHTGKTSGRGWSVGFADQTIQAWDNALRVNITSIFYITQELHRYFQSHHEKPRIRTSIILFSSIYGMVAPDFRLYEHTSMNNPMGYGASKGAILQLTRYLASQLHPIARVNCISPGGVWREDIDTAFSEQYIKRVPLGRMAHPDDIKGAVAYLASDLSDYVTGQNIVVDGGWTIW